MIDKLYITWEKFQKECVEITNQIKLSFTPDIIIGISRGGLIPAVVIANRLGENIKVLSIGISSYNKTVQQEIDLYQDIDVSYITNQKILIIDELCDSGKTLQFLKNKLENSTNCTVYTAALYVKQHSIYNPDFKTKSVESKFWLVWPWEETLQQRDYKKIAKQLYKKFNNYSEVGRRLSVCSETIRLWLNPKVHLKSLKYSKIRGSKTYHTKYKNNPDWVIKHKKQVKSWVLNNEERIKISAKQRYKQKGGYKGPPSLSQKAHCIRRRELTKLYDSNYNTEDIKYTYKLFKCKCAVCSGKKNLQIDHWLPLSKGNGLSRTNAVLLCKKCNDKKKAKPAIEVFEEQTVLKIEKLLNITKRYNID